MPLIQSSGSGWIIEHRASLAARITERYQRKDFGHLTHQMTVNDPAYYTKPWTVMLNKTLRADTEMLEFICLENEKDLQHMIRFNELGITNLDGE